LHALLPQVHIKHAGTAGMLFNPTQLAGIAPKIQRLASREHAISLRNEGASVAAERELALLSRHPPGPGPMQVAALHPSPVWLGKKQTGKKKTPNEELASPAAAPHVHCGRAASLHDCVRAERPHAAGLVAL
jgi:hypothetical protein